MSFWLCKKSHTMSSHISFNADTHMNTHCPNCATRTTKRCSQCKQPRCSLACSVALGCRRLAGCGMLQLLDLPDEMLEKILRLVCNENVRLMSRRLRQLYDSGHAALKRDRIVYTRTLSDTAHFLWSIHAYSNYNYCRRLVVFIDMNAGVGGHCRLITDDAIDVFVTHCPMDVIAHVQLILVCRNEPDLRALWKLVTRIPFLEIALIGCMMAWSSVTALASLETLRRLRLSHTILRGAALELTTLATGTPALRRLILSHCKLGDVEVRSLEPLSRHASLRRLDLSFNKITNASLETLTKFVNTPALVQLDLIGNDRFAPESTLALVHSFAVDSTRLCRLCLHNISITGWIRHTIMSYHSSGSPHELKRNLAACRREIEQTRFRSMALDY